MTKLKATLLVVAMLAASILTGGPATAQSAGAMCGGYVQGGSTWTSVYETHGGANCKVQGRLTRRRDGGNGNLYYYSGWGNSYATVSGYGGISGLGHNNNCIRFRYVPTGDVSGWTCS